MDGLTVLHLACNRDSPGIDMLHFLVENGGGEEWTDCASHCLHR